MHIRKLTLAVLAAILTLGLGATPAAAQQVSISAQLIHATNTPGQPDPKLGGLDKKLRGIFSFQSYKAVGSGSKSAAVPANTSIGLGRGNRLELALAPAGGNKVQSGIRWIGPSGQVLNTTVVMTRGVPVILGGGQQDGGTMIIAVTAR